MSEPTTEAYDRVAREVLASYTPSMRAAFARILLADLSYDPLTADEMAELVENPMLVHLYDAHRIVAALVRGG